MTWEYPEDNLIEQTAIDLFFNQLDRKTLLAYNKEIPTSYTRNSYITHLTSELLVNPIVLGTAQKRV
ncbi:MAG TPA: hypothetical protein GXX42_10040 [Petrimonas sp.]|uniref:hypothetical protein n=1 Tax=Petrimonas sp. TaxID=2023866 RepID=UPI000962656A|nr:MAG: hypothetical protein BGO33_02065 [Bacteroidia bacterium 43-41]HHV86130.1 hypothetical protein [Petrimonas sp.]